MNRVIFPLTTKMRGPSVSDLQAALQLLLERAVILSDDESARKKEFKVLKKEQTRQTYGATTKKLVALFQNTRGLPSSGEVDESTANALNALLQEWGLLDQSETSKDYVVSGTVRREDKEPLRDLRVRAFHESPQGSIRLGEDTIDGEGRYTITYMLLPGLASISLRVEVWTEDGVRLHASATIQGAQPLEIVDLTLPLTLRPSEQRRLEGYILFDNGLPAEKLKLRLYRIDFGGVVTQLGSDVETRDLGRYILPFDLGGKSAGLEIRAVDGVGHETPLSKPVYDLGNETQVIMNLVAPATLQSLRPEFERLMADVLPHMDRLDRLATVEEHEDRSDLTVLHQATRWDARVIAMAATATKLSTPTEIGLGADVLYGLFRVGLPSDKHELAQVSSDALGHALDKIQEVGILQLDENKKAEVKQAFERFSLKTRLAFQAPGSTATYGDFLTKLNMNEAAQTTFAKVFTEHRGDATSLWQKVGDAGLGPMVPLLQQQGKLAFLTTNNPDLTAKVQTELGNGDLKALVGKQYYKKEKWLEASKDMMIPPVFGSSETSREIYAEDMARKIRISYSTEVAWDMIKSGDLKIEGQGSAATVGAFLQNAIAKGFKLGESKIADFVKTNPDVWTGIPADQQTKTRAAVESLQRIYQITPSNEAMKALLDAGFISAQDVLAYPLETFIERFSSPSFSPEQARLVYRKAELVGNVTMSIALLGQELVGAPALPVMSGSEQERTDLIKKFPTLESLFGSLDYCECEHCRSVLSPAAYLVDLLQFMNPEPKVWDSFVKKWDMQHSAPYPFKRKAEHDAFLMKWREAHPGEPDPKTTKTPFEVLAERRPDIQHIPLTCENTHTVLPHIDLVNEMLEYYVVNRALGADAAKDTGTATTPELLAEPQYLEPKAYEILRQAVYPLTLPFDLWLETVRQFCDSFEIPLWKVLETFCRTDDLFSPTEPYDRAAVFIESLGLSPAEWALFTNPKPLETWHLLYGFDDRTKTAVVNQQDGIDALRSAKALSRRLEVTYKELVEVLRARFINPELSQLVVLNKLRLDIRDVKLFHKHRTEYEQNRDLLTKDLKALSSADQARYDQLNQNTTSKNFTWNDLQELDAFTTRLDKLAQEFPSFDKDDWLKNALPTIPFDRIVLLADPDTGCNFDLTTVQYADGKKVDAEVLLRINLFVRLWRKLGWTIEETDQALATFIPKAAPYAAGHFDKAPFKTALIYLAHLKALERILDLGKQEHLKLLTIWSDLSTTGKENLYAQLFLSRSMLKNDPVFDDPLGLYLADSSITAQKEGRSYTVAKNHVLPSEKLNPAVFAGQTGVITVEYDEVAQTQSFTYAGVLSDVGKASLLTLAPGTILGALLDDIQAQAKDYGLVRGHTLAIQGALGLTADEIDRILNDQATLDAATATLSIKNLSTLYRYAILAKALKITVADLISLKQLSGINPFELLKEAPLLNSVDDHPLSKTLVFVECARLIKASGLSIADLEYLFRHRFDAIGRYGAEEKKQVDLVENMLKGVKTILTDHAAPSDPRVLTDDWLKARLSLLLSPDELERLYKMINPTMEVVIDQNLFLTSAAEFTVTVSSVEPVDQLTGTIFTGDPFIRAASYDPEKKEQSLSFRGVLFDEHKQRVKADYASKLNSGQQVIFATLLDSIAVEPQKFFDKHLAGQSANGFLIQDLDVTQLFSPVKTDKLETLQKREEVRVHSMIAKRTRLAFALTPVLQRKLTRQLIVQTITSTSEVDEKLVEALVIDPLLFGDTEQPTKSLLDVFLEVGATQPIDESQRKRCAHTILRLSKALQLLQSLGLTIREVRYLLSHASDFDGFTFSTLPWRDTHTELNEIVRTLLKGSPSLTKQDAMKQVRKDNPDLAAEVEQTPRLFSQLIRLIRYTRLKQDMVGGGEGLIDVFELDAKIDEQQADIDKAGAQDKVYGTLAALTRRTGDVVGQVARALFKDPRFVSEQTVQRLWEGLQVIERFGVPVSALLRWTRIAKPLTAATDPTLVPSAIARDLKATLKARFEQETWQRIAQPIFDKLRRRQRDTLSTHVMHMLGFDRREQLFEYFLIDPGMEPVVQSSRIRAAISTAQIFVHRCFLNLEPWVQPGACNSGHWEWMKSYRVWEANRKVFLYPENWLEPEFRDDKTHLFTELEGKLLQGDVSADLVEDAFFGYLRKLDKLARLEIVGMYCEEHPLDPAMNTLHVIGRTYSSPQEYFYRRYAHQMWTPWEPVTAEIQGDHIVPVMWRNRLNLFWVTFMDQADPNAGLSDKNDFFREFNQPKAVQIGPAVLAPKLKTISGGIPGTIKEVSELVDNVTNIPSKDKKKTSSLAEMSLGAVSSGLRSTMSFKLVQVQLHWSEYFHEEWSTRESADFSAALTAVVSFGGFNAKNVHIYATKEMDGSEERSVKINLGGDINQAFRVVSRNSIPGRHNGTEAVPPRPYITSAIQSTQLVGNGALQVTFTQRTETIDGSAPSGPQATLSILRPGVGFALLPCGNLLDSLRVAPDIAALVAPMFYQDGHHTFFVEPRLKEQTIEEWQEWVTRRAEPQRERDRSEWWKELPVRPIVPYFSRPTLVDPEDPVWKQPIEPRARFDLAAKSDWVVNAATVLQFKDTLIGPTGRTGLSIQHNMVSGGAERLTVPIVVNPGSGLPTGSTVVGAVSQALNRTATAPSSIGLNIIGGNGLNQALVQDESVEARSR